MFALLEMTGFAAVEMLAANIPESVGIFVAGFGMAAAAVALRRFRPKASIDERMEAEQNL